MVTFLTSPETLGVALAVSAALLTVAVVWLLRGGPARSGRGGEIDLSQAAARGELTAFEWDWPRYEP